MLHPLRALLDAVDAHLGPALVPAARRGRIRALASRLPTAFGWGILECRLAPGEDRVDLMVCASASDGGRERLAALRPEEAAPARLTGLAPLFADWACQASPLHDQVPLVWLEYDLPQGRDPDPHVFLCVDPDYPACIRWPPLHPAGVRALGERGLSALLGRTPDGAILGALERCAERLPPAGRVLHLAAMPQRGARALRLLVSLPPEGVRPWLEAVSWPGRAPIDEALELVGMELGLIGIHVDVDEAVGPYFAVERDLDIGADPAAARRLIERLVRLGACEPQKGEAALGWMGHATVELPGADWFVNVQRHLYIKLIPARDGPLEAKAYLGFHGCFALL